MHFHAVAWIDHRDAHVLGFGQGEPSREVIKSEAAPHIHHKAGSIGSGHARETSAYFSAIASALAGYHEILIAGPAQTKTEFFGYLMAQRPELAKMVLGVETMGHASDREIIARAHHFFRRIDRTTPQR